MKKDSVWLLVILGVVGLGIGYIYLKDKKSAASNVAVGSTNSTVFPNTSTTSVPVADSTWNPAYRISNQQSAASQAMS